MISLYLLQQQLVETVSVRQFWQAQFVTQVQNLLQIYTLLELLMIIANIDKCVNTFFRMH